MRSEESSSEGLGGIGPEGVTQRFGTSVGRKTASGSAVAVSWLTRPKRLETRKTWCRRGLRRSQSTSSTWRPSWASTTARFDAVAVFPSPATAEVTAIAFSSRAEESIRAVRSER